MRQYEQEQRDELRELKKELNKELKKLDRQIKSQARAELEPLSRDSSSVVFVGNDSPNHRIQTKLNLLRKVVNNLKGAVKDE